MMGRRYRYSRSSQGQGGYNGPPALPALPPLGVNGLAADRLAEKSDIDNAKLSLAEQGQLLNQAKTLEALLTARAKLQNDYRKTVSSASAIHALSQLDPSDPEFQKDYASVLAQHADGLDSKGVQAVMQQKRNDFLLFQKAQHERNVSTFDQGPVQDAYQKAFDATGDPKLADLAAMSVKDRIDRSKKVLASPDVPQNLKDALFNPQTAQFDFSKLDPAEAASAAAAAQRKTTKEQIEPISALSKAMEQLNTTGIEETPAIKEARQNAANALAAYTGQLGPNANQPVTAQGEVARLLGGAGATPTPAPAAAAAAVPPPATVPGAAPAVTPQQAAGQASPALTPEPEGSEAPALTEPGNEETE